jgi:signal transduction histidine kinase
MDLKKAELILWLLLFCNAAFSQVQHADSLSITRYGFQNELTVTKGLSFFIDPDKSLDFSQIKKKEFNVPAAAFLEELHTKPQKNDYWVKFSIQNNTDSTLHPFFYFGDIDYISLYLVSPSQPLQKTLGGYLQDINKDIPEKEQLYLGLRVNLAPRQSGEVFVKLVQKSGEFDFTGIEIYKRDVLDHAIDNDYYNSRNYIIWGLLFQGFVLCQMLYVLFQWLIIRRREYLYYFFYLAAIILYFLSKQEVEFGESLFFSRHPIWGVYLNKTLQILPYFLYYRFIRYFLEIRQHYPALNKWIVKVENFLLVYLAFDFVFIATTLNIQLQTKIFTYIISAIFLVTAYFIIYLLRKRQSLIYFVLTGSLAVGLGNILGTIFTFLLVYKHVQYFQSTLMLAEIGIVIEILCFTLGLSYKSRLIEKEKLISQKNLVTQLKENQLLNSKMLNVRNKISLDLHDEIGSTLSAISILSEMALHEKKDTETALMLEEIKQNSISVMERMDDIVWNINPDNDSMEQLFLRIKIFAAKLFEAKGINYKIDIDEDVNRINVLMEYRQHIYLIMKEAINNLVKYSDCTEAAIIVSYNTKLLFIVIKDNGKGYNANTITFGNGLNSMKKRAEEMNAEIDMRSKINEGTTIQLFIKT